MNTFAPSATRLIRVDHSHVLATFQQYRADLSRSMKQGLVRSVGLALEIHAQLEEEIFYPAVQRVSGDASIAAKSVPEHGEMKRLIGVLRAMDAADPSYDSIFFDLMRDVMHHVADEETHVLPEAERLLGGQLNDLGAAMVKRRFELTTPRAGEFASNLAVTMPVGRILLWAGGVFAAYALWQLSTRRPGPRRGGD